MNRIRFACLIMLACAGTAHGMPILNIGGPETTAFLAFGDQDDSDGLQHDAMAVGFSLDRDFNNVTFSTLLICPPFAAGTPGLTADTPACGGEYYLMRTADPLSEPGDAGVDNLLAADTFSGDGFNQGLDEYTDLFTRDLTAGFYVLVTVITQNFAVWGAGDGAATTAVNGVSYLDSWFSQDVNGGQPWVADDGWRSLRGGGQPASFYFSLSTAETSGTPVTVPEPDLLTLFLGALGLVLLRRRVQH